MVTVIGGVWYFAWLVMNLAAFDYDAENVYEWGQALTKDGHLEINISRRHGYVPPASEHIL